MTLRLVLTLVAHHARIAAPEQAIAAVRAFLHTLGERMLSRDAWAVASALPPELASFLLSPPRAHGEEFSLEHFYFRMSTRDKTDPATAAHRARVIAAILAAYLPARARQQLLGALPSEFQPLFEPLPLLEPANEDEPSPLHD